MSNDFKVKTEDVYGRAQPGPDNLPFIGNLDEAAAVTLLLMCLQYFGIDLPNIFRRSKADEKTINVDPG